MNDVNLGLWIRYRATIRGVTYHSGGQRKIRRTKTYETTSERSVGVGEVDTSSVAESNSLPRQAKREHDVRGRSKLSSYTSP
jgi:hypothetical protein